MDQFFHSVDQAFGDNRRGAGAAAEVALLVLGLCLLWLGARWLLARRSRREGLRHRAADLGLSGVQLEGAAALARRHGADPLTLITHLDVFERVTGEALAGENPLALHYPLASLIRELRAALGFDRLPAFFPLLTSRELARGMALDVAGLPGQVARIDERSFAVEVHGPVTPSAGQRVALGLAHAREARYALQCALLESKQLAPGLWRLVFAHDESPVRVQQRDYARVPAEGLVLLRPPALVLAGREREAEGALEARLVDASAGGLQLQSAERLAAGSLRLASFELGGAAFRDLPAVVLSAATTPGGPFDLRLEFQDLDEPERARLVTAVARSAHPQPAATSARPLRQL